LEILYGGLEDIALISILFITVLFLRFSTICQQKAEKQNKQ